MWDNLIVVSWYVDNLILECQCFHLHVQTFPKVKKFRNNKASFPLYDALGEINDGTYNFVSLESPQEESVQIYGEEGQGLDEDDVQGEDQQVHVVEYGDVQGEDPQVNELEEVGQRRAHTP